MGAYLQTLIASAGNLGSKIAITLAKEGENVAIIEEDKARSEWLSKNSDATVYNGSILDPELLMRAGIETADAVVTVLENDETAMKFINFTKSQYGVPRIFAVAKNSESEDGLRESGATKVICSEDEVLDELENLFHSNGHRTIYFDRKSDWKIASASIRATSLALGKGIQKMKVKDSRIVALIRDGRVLFPDESTFLEMGDEIVIVGASKSVDKVVETISSES